MTVRLARDRGGVAAPQRRERVRSQPAAGVSFIASELLPPRPQRLFNIQLKTMRAMNENRPRRDAMHSARGAKPVRLIHVNDVVLLPPQRRHNGSLVRAR